jgi:hypothetical protein
MLISISSLKHTNCLRNSTYFCEDSTKLRKCSRIIKGRKPKNQATTRLLLIPATQMKKTRPLTIYGLLSHRRVLRAKAYT